MTVWFNMGMTTTRTATIGDIVTLPRAENSNGIERTNVTGRIVGFRATIVVLETTEGSFVGEGVWGNASDIATARTADHVVTVNGTIHVITDALDAEFTAARYRSTYRLAIVKIIPLDEYRVWAPETGR